MRAGVEDEAHVAPGDGFVRILCGAEHLGRTVHVPESGDEDLPVARAQAQANVHQPSRE